MKNSIAKRLTLSFFLLCLSTVSAMVSADIVVSKAYVREPVPGMSMTAAYMTVENTTDKAVALVTASSPQFGHVEVHEHIHEDGLMKMREVQSININAGQQAVFQPGGLHLMLFASKTTVSVGDSVEIILNFADGQQISHQYPVKSLVKQ